MEQNEIELKEFGENVKKYIKLRKLSAQKVANLVGVEKSTIIDITNGASNCRLSTLIGICYALKVTPNDLIPHTRFEEPEA